MPGNRGLKNVHPTLFLYSEDLNREVLVVLVIPDLPNDIVQLK